uniref:receptor for retinol uptake STRA6 isoform X2 n=1 Tax=Myxine glutinosa TaxID=7769 RepID=UPI00358EB12A
MTCHPRGQSTVLPGVAPSLARCLVAHGSILRSCCLLGFQSLMLIVIFLLSFLVKRKRLWKGSCHGSPGLLVPLWYPEGLPDRRVFAAAFGLLVCAYFRVTLEDQPLPFITSQKQHQELLMIVAFLYYGVLYFPLLACAQIPNRNAHVLGCLFSWVYLGSLVSQKMECPSTALFYAYYSILAAFPQILCLLYLSIKYPLLLYNDFVNDSELGNNQEICCLQSHQLEYVRQLFKRKISKMSEETSSVCSSVWAYLSYSDIKGFRYPSTSIISMVVSVITVYQAGSHPTIRRAACRVSPAEPEPGRSRLEPGPSTWTFHPTSYNPHVALLSTVLFVPLLQKVRSGVGTDIAYVLASFGLVLSPDNHEVVRIFKHILWTTEVCYIVSITTACITSFHMILRTFEAQRTHLMAIYKGEYPDILRSGISSDINRSCVVSWMSFGGLQMAHIILAFILKTIIFFYCAVILSFTLIVPPMHGLTALALEVIKNHWVILFVLLFLAILQHGMAHFVFLRSHGSGLHLDNLRLFFITTYLFFCYNVMVGFVVCIGRICVSALYNILHIARLDVTLLNTHVALHDPGHRSYIQFLQLEALEWHPVVRCFCRVLLCHMQHRIRSKAQPECKIMEEGLQLMPGKGSSERVRTRWLLAYTLLKNPNIAAFRKHALDPQDHGATTEQQPGVVLKLNSEIP